MRIWPFYSEAAVDRVTRLVRAGSLAAAARDPDIAACEAQVAQVLTPGHDVLLCSSGTAALTSVYAALGLDGGSEVLVPTHTFRATVTPLLQLGLRPVLCDSDPDTGNIDLADAERRITSRTQALVVTHVWGRPVPLDAARSLADRRGLALVEDCSHAHGTHWRGTPVGTVGDAAVFSLGTTKMVSGGMAGALVTRDRRLFERAVVFGQPKHRGLAETRDSSLRALLQTGLGNNLRASPIAAVLAGDHLSRLPETIRVKNDNLAALTQETRPLLPRLAPVPVSAERSAGTLYKFHYRWHGDDAQAADVVRLLHRHGLRVRRPAAPLHRTPLFGRPELLGAVRASARPFDACDPAGFPQADRFLAGLIELDTRDLYEPSEQVRARHAEALRAVAEQIGAGEVLPC